MTNRKRLFLWRIGCTFVGAVYDHLSGGLMKRTLMLLMLMAVAVLALAAGNGTQTKPHHMGAMIMMNNRDDCPMDMKETDFAVLDTPTDVVLTATTQPEKVADLQRRIERMSAMRPMPRMKMMI